VAEDGRRFRRLPLRNTNKKFNPITAPTMHFAVYGDPDGGRVSTEPFPEALEIKPVFGDGAPAVWRWSPPRIAERPDDLECRWVRGSGGVRADVFQRDWRHPVGGRRKKLQTIWMSAEIGSTDTAVQEVKALLGPVFASPKPTGLLRRIIETMPPDARVLDYFAGSGTTGHAIALANLADGGRRTCLSVNSAEPVVPGSSAAVAGFETVSAITRARLRAVADRLGGGFVEVVPDEKHLNSSKTGAFRQGLPPIS
jgi:adenine-specific DNA-methyltransferase